MLAILVFQKCRQEDWEFKASQSSIMKPCVNNNKVLLGLERDSSTSWTS